MVRQYTVVGSWPFPLDMLRHDQSRAATPVDQAKIDRLSGESAPDLAALDEKVEITLVAESSGLRFCNAARWESFGWQVPGDADYQTGKSLRAAADEQRRLRSSGLAKLTMAERRALGFA